MVDTEDLFELITKFNTKDTTSFMLIEEMSEVMQAISHFRRERITKVDLAKEICQARIQLEIFCMHFDIEEEVNSFYIKEIDKLFQKVLDNPKSFKF